MIRVFRSITRGKILEELKADGLVSITPLQFLRIEKRYIEQGKINPARRSGGGWRIYTREEADIVKDAIWEYYGGREI